MTNPLIEEWYRDHDEELPDLRPSWRLDPITGFIEEMGATVIELDDDCPICGRDLDHFGRCVRCLEYTS